MRTKKAGWTGRYGPRYGSTVRKRVRLIMEKMKGRNLKCPRCETVGSVFRESTGIWYCRKCSARFTGGAYYTETPRGTESLRIAKRKQREVEVSEE